MYPGIGRGPVFWWCTIRIIYHLVHHLQTPLTELNIVYMWGFLITVEVMTPPEPDLVYTLTAGSRPPVWFYGYCPSSPAHHHQTELPSLTTTLPAAPAKTLSTCPPTENIYICIHKMWIQGGVMEHCTKTWLISMACQGHFNLYAWKINIGEHHQEISYYKRYMYYGNDWKRWFYLLHWNNLNTHLGICIWTFPIVDTDL